MPDSENSKPESTEPSPAPSQPPLTNDLFGGSGLREIEAAYEMIVNAKKAINRNDHWHGDDLGPMAMLMMMLSQMETQHRQRLEQLREEQKDMLKRAREEIRKAGGQVNGEAAISPATPAA